MRVRLRACLAALLLATTSAACGPDVDLTKGLQILDVSSGWFDAGLVNGQTADTVGKTQVPSVLLTPEWVTAKNMNATIIADQFVPAHQLCTAKYKAACQAAGISG